MRLLLKLTAQNKFLPVNYNYYLSAAIYKLLQLGSPEFSQFLHDIGYELKGRRYKLFSFALRFDKIKIDTEKILLLSPLATLNISSPVIDNFIQNFILGTFEEQKIEIAGDNLKTVFSIVQVESLPEPVFDEQNYFTMLSPLVLSTKKESGNSLTQYFFRYNDDIAEINRVFNQNLKQKYQLIHQKEYAGDDLLLQWDDNYINNKLSEHKRLTKKISITKPGKRPVEVIANEIPFKLSGNKELIYAGYAAGFGEKNSMGFGMTELCNKIAGL